MRRWGEYRVSGDSWRGGPRGAPPSVRQCSASMPGGRVLVDDPGADGGRRLPDLGLRPYATEQPGARADDGDWLAPQGVIAKRARGQADCVLELAGNGGVVLG